MASKSPVQKEKIDLAMSRLEKLKQEVASIEAKYRILDGHYSVICDEALTKIDNARTILRENDDSVSDEPGDAGVTGHHLKTGHENGASPEGKPNYHHNQLLINESSIPPPQRIPVIDDVADAIETGLDKIGDALIYPFDAVIRLHKKVTGSKPIK